MFNFGGDTNDVVLVKVVLHEGEWSQLRSEPHELARRVGTGNHFMAAWAMLGRAAPEDPALLSRSRFNRCRIGCRINELDGPAPNFAAATRVACRSINPLNGGHSWFATTGDDLRVAETHSPHEEP